MTIAQDDVFAAADAIAARGGEPTNASVRAELGDRGSFSTISPLIKEWREQQEEIAALPAEVEARALEAAGTIYTIARDAAERAYHGDKAKMQAQLTEAHTARDEALDEVHRLESVNAELEAANEEMQTAVSDASEALSQARVEVTEVRSDCSDQVNDLKSQLVAERARADALERVLETLRPEAPNSDGEAT
ncbi:replication region DNA-binding N-term [Roseivivax halotolerans]|uniref:Replication region DNA-binding N-term n=1 Tax=Roseivivax halotolerans TaxID=93684 RepID=A0A1I6AKM4_9RHOB|nr:DNA-binding protein [Roseivivax halotolerans]SFQ69229.1 replication region DNA-binding N-term [Roseivivax halotolerans]